MQFTEGMWVYLTMHRLWEEQIILISFLGFNSTGIENFQIYKLNLEKAEEPEIKGLTFVGSLKKQGNYRENIYCFINYARARKQQLELDVEQQIGSK